MSLFQSTKFYDFSPLINFKNFSIFLFFYWSTFVILISRQQTLIEIIYFIVFWRFQNINSCFVVFFKLYRFSHIFKNFEFWFINQHIFFIGCIPKLIILILYLEFRRGEFLNLLRLLKRINIILLRAINIIVSFDLNILKEGI